MYSHQVIRKQIKVCVKEHNYFFIFLVVVSKTALKLGSISYSFHPLLLFLLLSIILGESRGRERERERERSRGQKTKRETVRGGLKKKVIVDRGDVNGCPEREGYRGSRRGKEAERKGLVNGKG